MIKGTAAALFIASFGVYLFSSAPALAPYRDMGEMVAVSDTLGIAHPPGYPVYTLAGKIAAQIPLANKSYRLNILSVAGGAAACALLFLILAELGVPYLVCVLACVLWLSSTSFWVISVVTEMYSLNLAAGLALTYLWLLWERRGDLRLIFLSAYLTGLFLGIRPDILLMVPALAVLVFARLKAERRGNLIPAIGLSASLSLIGFSVFLYLLVRSNMKPLFNWNRPETLERLWASLLRKSHGGTLDLLSKNYSPGELFWTDMAIYVSQIAKETFYAGIPLLFAGLWRMWKENKSACLFIAIAWGLTGPFFIYKANLPPNPHALAVLEAHFNLSKAFLYIWIGYGLSFFFRSLPKPGLRAAAFAAALLLALLGLGSSWKEASKRNNLFGYDYGRNIFRTLPADSILIMKKDVQLFIFWALQYAEGLRRDVSVVPQGLCGSPWYIQTKSEEGFPVKLGPLKNEADFSRFLKENPSKPVFAGWDADVPSIPGAAQLPHGLTRKLAPPQAKDPSSGFPNYLRDIYVYRGKYNYEAQNEFFSSDLIDDYSKAHFGKALELSADLRNQNEARLEWDHSIRLHSENPNLTYRRGFLSYQAGNIEEAYRDFTKAEILFEKTARQTKFYHSLPEVVDGVKSEWAQVLLNKGAVLEKLGRREESEQAYLKALGIVPNLAQAHYNLAVLFWDRDWDRVLSHLREALRLDPNHSLARQFYPRAVAKSNERKRG